MKNNILKYCCAALLIPALSGCLDYDIPSDEFSSSQKQVDDTVYSGDADKLDYEYQPTEEEVDDAVQAFNKNDYFGQFLTAGGYLMGSKAGIGSMSEHSYQYYYSLTTDNYAGYTTMINSSFMGGFTIETTYSYTRAANEGPYGRLLDMKNYLGNQMNNDLANYLVEYKALCLLMFDHVALEMTDLYGAIPYSDHKSNKQTNPFTFNKGADIYAAIVKNLDDINACLANFENRPDWYKDRLNEILLMSDGLSQDGTYESWRRYANSLKLRLAMHYVKYDPSQAQQWAEEAVAAGVVESQQQEMGFLPTALVPVFGGIPMKAIMSGWNDIRVNASFISMLTSLQHPYIEYMISKNSNEIINQKTGETMPANTAIVGVRAGQSMYGSQQYFSNMRVAYSQFEGEDFEFMPAYAIKWAEMDFHRAEGALRGWNMGGTAQFFYERGIRNGCCGLRNEEFMESPYDDLIEDYLEVTQPVEYTYVDPMGTSPDIESVTKIGVKWNEGDDPETKLEKIMTQKYIAVFPYSYEAWTDMRRTGYPKTFPVLKPYRGDYSLLYGDLIRRMPLPYGDTSAGLSDISTSGLDAIGGADLQATRVFWDIDQPNF